MDYGHEQTDKMLKKLEKQIHKEYSKAAKEVEKSMLQYLKRFEENDNEMLSKLNAGEITKKEYTEWRNKQMIINDKWQKQRDQLTETYMNADKVASELIKDTTYEAYALNHNYGTFEAEKGAKVDTSYTLYSKDTVARLVKDDPQLLPKIGKTTSEKIRRGELKKWNEKQIQSVMMQGVLQGESIPKIAKRLATTVGEKNSYSHIRAARTMTTSAENAGRIDSYKRAESMGIKMKKQWLATLDGRTRHSHRILDGESVPINKEFSNGLMFPADPDGDDPAEIYNCRCTLIADIAGFSDNIDDLSLRRTGEGFTDYETWKDAHEEATVEHRLEKVVNGKNISKTWHRREDKFDFEIEDIINAQGFDGLPRVVGAKEFDRAVANSNFIAQRTYSASSQEILDSYREQLYSGKWYVDCSTGGAAYGRGMYSVYNNGTTITEYMEREMNGYRARRGIEYNYIETFTLAPDAKTITPNEIIELRKTSQERLNEEFKKRGGWSNPEAIKWASEHDMSHLDDGAFAALLGYDAILASEIDNYAIILNRTKCIFKRS